MPRRLLHTTAASWLMRLPVLSVSRLDLQEQDLALRPSQVPLVLRPTPN